MVANALWRSRRFQALADDAKLLLLYLLTNEHQTSAGAYRLLAGYACVDLGWVADRFRCAMDVLLGAEMVMEDRDTSEILILRWFKHCPPMNAKHRTGASDGQAIRTAGLRAGGGTLATGRARAAGTSGTPTPCRAATRSR